MNIPNRLFAAIVAALTIAAMAPLQGASFVKVAYSQNKNEVASMVYIGPDGGPASERARYWKLLGKAPQSAYDVKIKPDRAGGMTATLKGEIEVSVEIRNQFKMGVVNTDKLTLVRDGVDSTKWYLPAKELERIVKLIDKKQAKKEEEKEGAVDPTPATDSKSE